MAGRDRLGVSGWRRVHWAIQDQNTPTVSGEKQQIPSTGAVKSAANRGDSAFADAVAAVMKLPLSDAEKAEAIRRLLAEEGR